MKTQMSDRSTWMSTGNPSSLFRFISQTVTVSTISNRLYIVHHSHFSFRSGNGKQGIGADSKVAMTNKTLVNESIIVFPLFNVKKKNLWYIIFKVLHLIWVFCHSVSIYIHSVEDLGSSNQWGNDFWQHCSPWSRTLYAFKINMWNFFKRSVCPLNASHTSTCLHILSHFYIFF